ncbi:MAG: cytochrome c [Elusimicrobia bacterium]|nr:cytochrome c [Elusimicrobiota bacterium]
MRALWVAVFLAAVQPAEATLPGKELFDAAGCAACHRVGGVGGNSGPDLSLVGFRRNREWLDLWLAVPRTWKNDTMMPEFALKPAARAALVDYLASLDGPDYHPTPAGDPVTRGRAVYLRAGCVACHGAKGAGGHPNNNVPGDAIPALAKVAETFSPAELAAKIRRGSVPAAKDPAVSAPLVRMPAWGEKLADDEISAVAAYLLSLGADQPREEW